MQRIIDGKREKDSLNKERERERYKQKRKIVPTRDDKRGREKHCAIVLNLYMGTEKQRNV